MHWLHGMWVRLFCDVRLESELRSEKEFIQAANKLKTLGVTDHR